MKKFTKLVGLCTALMLALLTSLNAQTVAKRIIASNGDSLLFLQYIPAGHNVVTNTRKYPLIIFLHGGGERSNQTSLNPGDSIYRIRSYGPNRIITNNAHKMNFTWNGQVDTFIVLSPMSRKYRRLPPQSEILVWPTEYVDAIMKYARDSLKVDTCRIYLTGHSFGGGGTFNYLNNSLTNAKKFAAAAPVSAWNTGLNASGYSNVSNAKLPLWGYHAIDDAIAPYALTENSINGVNALSPQVKALISLWPTGSFGAGNPHNDAPLRLYDVILFPYGYDGILNNYEWFLGQNKCLPVNVLPVARVGNDTTILASPGSATLNGGTSTDADGTIVRYVWKKISGPASGTIATTLGTASSTTVSGLTTVGIYKYQLNVVDNRAAIARDTLTITVVSTLGKAVAIRDTTGARIIAGNVIEFKNSSAFTVEAYIKYDPTMTDWFNMEASIFRDLVTTTDRIRLHVDKPTNSVHFTVANGTDVKGVTASNVVSPNTWYHVAAVFDGTQTGNANRMKIYINGVSQTLSFTGTIPAITSGSTPSCIFAGEPSAYRLTEIDEVRAWNTALSASTINSWKDKLLGNCHPDFNQLFLYWPLDNDTNPSSAAAALGTSYSSPIFYGNYVNSTQATANNGCSGARLAQALPLNKIVNNKPLTGKIYPNPTTGLTYLELNAIASKSITVKVLDTYGRILSVNKTSIVKGDNRISVNITSLPSGVYYIEVSDGKFILEKYRLLKQ
jgi:predicted esterase